MLTAKIRGAILFGSTSGIAQNLGKKAEDTGLHVGRVPRPEPDRTI